VRRLIASYRVIPRAATVRLAKPTSNLFRARAKRDAPGLDTSGLTDVIRVDPGARTADVAGMCTYDDLVTATLPYGLSPLVVPQLKTITLGGAVTGLGIESASFRNGLPHESVLEMDILTGAGEVITASPNQHQDLFRGFPNSYGTLGYSVRLKIELETVKPFVALRHIRFHSLDDLVAAVRNSVVNRQTASNAKSDWVFPGYMPGRHLSANHVRLRLKALGFPSLSTRIGTWQTITQTSPPPVLADALGLHPQTAIRHAQRGSGQYGAYVADRRDADNPE